MCSFYFLVQGLQSPPPPASSVVQQPFQTPPPSTMAPPQMPPGLQSPHMSPLMSPPQSPPASMPMASQSMAGMGRPFPGPPPPGPGGFQQPGLGSAGQPGYPQQAGNSEPKAVDITGFHLVSQHLHLGTLQSIQHTTQSGFDSDQENSRTVSAVYPPWK